MANAVLHTFKVRVEEPGNGVLTKTIEAAYFQDDGRYTVFKDVDNQAVYAARQDNLLSVERVQLTGGPRATESAKG